MKIDFKKINKICVLYVSRTLGDSLWFTLLPKLLKKNFPEKNISVTSASQVTTDIFTNNPHIDEIIEVYDKEKRYEKLQEEIIKRDFDLLFVINIFSGSNQNKLFKIADNSNIPLVVVQETKSGEEKKKFDLVVPFKDEMIKKYKERTKHTSEIFLDIGRYLGLNLDAKER